MWRRQKVGQGSFLNDSKLAGHLQYLGIDEGRGLDEFQRTLDPTAQFEFEHLVGVDDAFEISDVLAADLKKREREDFILFFILVTFFLFF